MSFNNCLLEIEAAAGRKFSDEEMDELLTEAQARIEVAKARNTSGDLEEAVLRAVDRLGCITCWHFIDNRETKCRIYSKHISKFNRSIEFGSKHERFPPSQI